GFDFFCEGDRATTIPQLFPFLPDRRSVRCRSNDNQVTPTPTRRQIRWSERYSLPMVVGVGATSANYPDTREVALPSSQHQPAAVQQIAGLGRPLLGRDADVVHRRTALLHRAACGSLAFAEAGGHEQVDDRVGVARSKF